MVHVGFVVGEILLLALYVALAMLVRANPGPLPGDLGLSLDLQHWLRPHRLVTETIDLASTIAWPLPSAITAAAVAALLLLMRRWLDTIVLLLATGLADGVDFIISQFVHRPRPAGPGLYVAQVVKSSFSFPSGHVLHSVAFFGFLLFLTFQVQRPAPWFWPLRVFLLALILSMGPSRILEGEHWPSDVLAGFAFGGFWLLLATHAYAWAGRRWPRLRGGSSAEPSRRRPLAAVRA